MYHVYKSCMEGLFVMEQQTFLVLNEMWAAGWWASPTLCVGSLRVLPPAVQRLVGLG